MPLRFLAGSGRGRSGIDSPGSDEAAPSLASRRRAFQVTLGVIWLLDAALQFQPYMFTRAFVRDVILPTASGNPAIVGRPIIWSGDLMLRHIVIINAAFATLQLLLAVGMFWRPAVRAALAASIVWSLAVWWLGEGMGGSADRRTRSVRRSAGGRAALRRSRAAGLAATRRWPSARRGGRPQCGRTRGRSRRPWPRPAC